MRHSRPALIAFMLGGLLLSGSSHAQTAEDARLAAAGAILNAFTSDPPTAIPPLILQQAKAIAIIPDVVRVGFVFGGRRGKGIVVVRTEDGSWSNPSFVTLTGGSIGAQIGAESADLVFVFGSERSVRNLSAGKFTVGTDASATAGPVGRNSTATRDMTFTAELYTYVRSRGLFAGATVEGSKLGIDHAANRNYYAPGGTDQPLSPVSIATAESARRLLTTLGDAETSTSGAPRVAEQTPTEEAPEETILYPLGAN